MFSCMHLKIDVHVKNFMCIFGISYYKYTAIKLWHHATISYTQHGFWEIYTLKVEEPFPLDNRKLHNILPAGWVFKGETKNH